MNDDTIKEAVRDRYAGHATNGCACCGSSTDLLGYDAAELAALPGDADLQLGCGNPLGLESIVPGETVVDLGSGGGIDCFIAAKRTGERGHVIGVDMTPEMVLLAIRNATNGGFANVEFRLGEIEDLPLDDGVADLVISNCVINLVPDKCRAFAEAFRIVRPGGRISFSDIVTTEPLPEPARASVAAYVACLGGASTLEEYLAAARAAGFAEVAVVHDVRYAMEDGEAESLDAAFTSAEESARAAMLFRSVTVQARKPIG